MLERIGIDDDGTVGEEDFISYFLSGMGALPRDQKKFEQCCEEFMAAALYMRDMRSKLWSPKGVMRRVLGAPITIRGILIVTVLILVCIWVQSIDSKTRV